ncbi:hypothetical protein BKM32_16230 [Mangrovimonas sp. DI 80]|nr:hypothetical protein BKM32_16230 [Mangrovimonas sp. DI 80]
MFRLFKIIFITALVVLILKYLINLSDWLMEALSVVPDLLWLPITFTVIYFVFGENKPSTRPKSIYAPQKEKIRKKPDSTSAQRDRKKKMKVLEAIGSFSF